MNEKYRRGWIGVDFDGTLVKYDGSLDDDLAPVPAMLARVKAWVAKGIEVKIVTARAEYPNLIPPIHAWCVRHGLPELEVTNKKDFAMIRLYDDRAVQVESNTGRLIGEDCGEDVGDNT